MLENIRSFMVNEGIDAFLIGSSDPHQSEYLAPHWQLIPALTGFTGSSATVVITQDEAHLWTDSRYWIQAENQLNREHFTLQKLGDVSVVRPKDWLFEHLSDGNVIGIDGSFISQTQFQSYKKKADQKNQKIKLRLGSYDLFWPDRPALPASQVYLMPESFSEFSVIEKITQLREETKANGGDALLICDLDEIGWILHARGKDIDCNTGIVSYLIIGPEYGYWFVDEAKLSVELKGYFEQMGVEILPYGDINNFCSQPDFGHWNYVVDTMKCPANLYQDFDAKRIISRDSFVTMKKAVKSAVEIGAIYGAMIQDGCALTNAYFWLDQNVGHSNVTEFDFSKKLTESRGVYSDFQSDSFHPIVGWNENGAIVHYRPGQETSNKIQGDGILLVDSGGHYLQGTTDITRMSCFGFQSDDYKLHYTLVLKGHIALATALFPQGTSGAQLDVLARQFLWQEKKNFGHGTGHGVGFCANVHEGPQSISPRVSRYSKQALLPGMLVTNEPGYYKPGEYGIRIENILLVKKTDNDNEHGFLSFETLTLFPIDTSPILISRLERDEIEWLNNYHQKVRERLIPRLENKAHQFWILEKTRPI